MTEAFWTLPAFAKAVSRSRESMRWLKPDTCRLLPGLRPPPPPRSLRSGRSRSPPPPRTGERLLLERLGASPFLSRSLLSSLGGDRPAPLPFQGWSSAGGPPLLASWDGMLMPPVGAISWDCHAGEERWNGVRSSHRSRWRRRRGEGRATCGKKPLDIQGDKKLVDCAIPPWRPKAAGVGRVGKRCRPLAD